MALKFSDKAKKLIGAIAPGLGAALGGPLGGLAGNMIADALGGEANVEKALLSQNPEILLALKNADQAFAIKMEELGVDRERIELADTADARALARTDMRPHMWLSAIFILGYFSVLFALLFGGIDVPKENKELFGMLFGIITLAMPIILQFWFGSSHGSIKKTDMLKQGQP